MKFQILLLAGLFVASPAIAQSNHGSHDHGQSAAPAASAPVEESASERKICRTVQVDTGTRIGGRKKLCLTAAEWRRYDRAN